MDRIEQIALAERFHAQHHASEMLILPNAWDAGSAVIFERAGFRAIGTTSAGIAYSLGYPDGQRIALDDVIDAAGKMLRRLHVPLSVDVEMGFGTTIDQIVTTVRCVIELGAVGINLEDPTPEGTDLTPIMTQCDRIKALAELKRELGIPFFINARTDVYWLALGSPESRLEATLERCVAYAAAGADGVFVPGALDRDAIQELVERLDVIASPANPSPADLQALGVARLSLGSGPVRAALGLTQRIAAELCADRSLTTMFSTATPYADMNQLFEG